MMGSNSPGIGNSPSSGTNRPRRDGRAVPHLRHGDRMFEASGEVIANSALSSFDDHRTFYGAGPMRQLRHPKVEEITLTGVLGALCDPVRLSIVSTLAKAGCERAWGEFEVDVCPSTLSHHLKTLRTAEVIDHRKDGTRCFVSLRPDLERVFPGLLRCILEFASREARVPRERTTLALAGPPGRPPRSDRSSVRGRIARRRGISRPRPSRLGDRRPWPLRPAPRPGHGCRRGRRAGH
jgi:DNA-binding transcriptional ArsR family regulator